MRIIILGLGNTLRSDSGVGIYVIRQLRNIENLGDVNIEESDLSGFGLLDLMDGYDVAILVDAIKTPTGIPGNIYRYDLSDGGGAGNFKRTAHIDMEMLLEKAKARTVYLPKRIIAYTVEVEDLQSFEKGCTEEVLRAIPRVIQLVLGELKKELSAN